jgi:hypothetical protein
MAVDDPMLLSSLIKHEKEMPPILYDIKVKKMFLPGQKIDHENL